MVVDRDGLARLLDGADYPALEKRLAAADLGALAKVWEKFPPMRKLVLFKLLDAPRALEFYEKLPFAERYFLLCGFPLQSIAPVLEKLGPVERTRFVSLPRDFYERMFRMLAA